MPDPSYVLLGLGFGALIGISLGALGAGGSILTVPILVYAMGVPVQAASGTSLAIVGLPMRLAVGTSLLAIALNAVLGLLGHPRFGGLDRGLTLLFGIGGLIGVLVGSKLAGRVPEKGLRIGFALLIVGVAAFTFVRSAATLVAG